MMREKWLFGYVSTILEAESVVKARQSPRKIIQAVLENQIPPV
jgi:hypothetical protein